MPAGKNLVIRSHEALWCVGGEGWCDQKSLAKRVKYIKMRITILTSYEGISALVLSRIIPLLSGHQISCLYTTQKDKLSAPTRLQALANYDASVLRAHRGIFEELEGQVANDVNEKDFDIYSSTVPDLVVSLRHMSILGSRAIAVPRFGIINLHSGDLPKYRGVMATFRAMINREEQISSTLHWIKDSKIDRGAIISRSSIDINYASSYYENLEQLYAAGSAQISKTVEEISSGSSPVGQKMAAGGAYYSWPGEVDLHAFPFPLFPCETENMDLS